ncbi:trypsin-4-like [Contarinia nasturtii]|uniref:trypsin-4-like n=1 Tax=Contarinia nasturtii TaxID=265458 RepID=UPI0012D44C54|nr:trypsin-4-like [Contarinia nasturtii]
MFIVKTSLLLSTFLFASGGLVGFEPKPKLDGRIVGGFLIDIKQVPWQAAFETRDSHHICGACIISDRWLLTAAHCLAESMVPLESLIIRTDSSVSGEGGTIHNIKRIIPHENYNPQTIEYDFALIELTDSIEFNNKLAKPIALPNAYEILRDDTMCLVSGWGLTLKETESSKYLRGVEVPIVNQEKCRKLYRGFITSSMICAGYDEGMKDACTGDSGGPLAAIDETDGSAVLIGVVSWGSGCAQPNYPGVYGRVETIRDWIHEMTGL